MDKCECKDPDAFYYPATNEDGWKCLNCMKALGFRPDLDREFIYEKVEGIMQDMQMSNLAYFSNSTEGHMIASQVASECSRQNLYDQATIILEIMRVVQPDKSLFWQSKASGAMVETLDVVNQKEVSADWWEN